MLRMQASRTNWGGIAGTKAVYLYHGFKAKQWSSAIDQDGFNYKEHVVGTVVRANNYQVSGRGRVHPQGEVGTFQMTKL